MKKITLLIFTMFCFSFGFSQTLNQNANWPNPSWTIDGTYSTAAGAFEANPTVDANFAFDDDDAGNPSDDNIVAESPVIDLTAAFNAGEVWLTITADYVYRYLANDELLFQYWDADASAWVNWGPSFDALGTTTSLTDDFCSGTPETYTSPVLDITTFTATQQSGFRYRISYDDDPAGGDWNYGFCFSSPTITSAVPPTDELDFYNLQWPANGTIAAGETFDVYARAYEAGLTDVTSGQAPGIESWIGYSTTDTDPNGAEWTWIPADFNVEVGNDDEYTLNLAASIPALGTYYYASRWRLNGGYFTYGGIQADGSYGGIWGEDNNISGVLTVNPPANDDCDDAISLTVNSDFSCTDVTAGTILGATDSGANDATCFGTPDDDVWYSFVATSTAHRVSLIDQTGSTTDMYMTFYDGTSGCGSLGESVACSDPQTANLTGLTIGTTYYVQVYTYTATGGQTSAFNICVGTPPPPPVNDECADALPLTESTDSSCANAVSGTTVSANPSASGTCSTAGKDVWYAFTPSTTGNYNFTVSEVTDYGFSSTYVTLYSGDCGATTQIGSSCSTTSISNVPLTASTPYYVVVRTTSSSTGVDFSLCAYPSPPPPANDLCADAVSLVCDQTIDGTTIDATGGSGTSCIGSIGNDVWYQYSGNDSTVDLTVLSSTTGEEAQIEVYSSTDGTCSGFTLATCFESEGEGENPTLLSFDADAGTTYFIRVGNWINGNAGLEFSIEAECTPYPDCGDPTDLVATVTSTTADISWTAPAAGTPVGYNWEIQPDGVAQGTAGAIDSGTTAITSDTATGMTPETAYDLFVQTDCGGDGTSAWTGPYSFTTAATPPANDDCNGAISLTVNSDFSCTDVTAGTVVGATDSGANDATCFGTPDDDVWYSFVATSTAHRVSLIDQTGSTTDMYMVFYDGTSGCGSLGESVACSDPQTANLTGLTIGTTYYVQVYTYTATGGQTSAFNICVGTPPPPPANDACSGANAITSLPYDFSQTDGAAATNNAGFITACSADTAGSMNDGLWFTFTTATDGTVDIVVSNVSAGFDPQIDLYSGSCGTFACVGTADSGFGGDGESIIAQAVTAGTQYYINVGNWSGTTNNPEGSFDINVTGTVTLGIESVDNNSGFTYFPNPVKSTLNLKGQSNIQNVSVYNMLGQEVLRTSPNALNSEVNMASLQVGAYFVKVTINDATETIRVIKQ